MRRNCIVQSNKQCNHFVSLMIEMLGSSLHEHDIEMLNRLEFFQALSSPLVQFVRKCDMNELNCSDHAMQYHTCDGGGIPSSVQNMILTREGDSILSTVCLAFLSGLVTGLCLLSYLDPYSSRAIEVDTWSGMSSNEDPVVDLCEAGQGYISVEGTGRLGNVIGQYATLYGLAKYHKHIKVIQ